MCIVWHTAVLVATYRNHLRPHEDYWHTPTDQMLMHANTPWTHTRHDFPLTADHNNLALHTTVTNTPTSDLLIRYATLLCPANRYRSDLNDTTERTYNPPAPFPLLDCTAVDPEMTAIISWQTCSTLSSLQPTPFAPISREMMSLFLELTRFPKHENAF